MKHLFVPYEIALKLKEKGFDEPCFGYYNNHPPKNNHPRGLVIGLETHGTIQNHNEETEDDDLICSSPLYQQVIDWFREKKIKIVEQEQSGWDVYTFYNDRYIIERCCSDQNEAIEEALNLIK